MHIKLDSGEPFYIGKGRQSRAFKIDGRSKIWKSIVNKHGYDILFIEENLNEDESLELEKYWIKRIGRRDLNNGSLVNFTDGGEGISNPSAETRMKIGKANSGRPITEENRKAKSLFMIGKKLMLGKRHTEESKKKMSETSKGRKHTEESKKKISISLSKRKHTEESKRKIGNYHRGRKHSEESKKKMSEANKGKKNSDESKRKISEKLKNRIFSEEHRQKISQSRKGMKFTEEHKKKLSDAAKLRCSKKEEQENE